MDHSTTNMTPKEAMKEKNELKAKHNMTLQAVRTRKYPTRSVRRRSRFKERESAGKQEG